MIPARGWRFPQRIFYLYSVFILFNINWHNSTRYWILSHKICTRTPKKCTLYQYHWLQYTVSITWTINGKTWWYMFFIYHFNITDNVETMILSYFCFVATNLKFSYMSSNVVTNANLFQHMDRSTDLYIVSWTDLQISTLRCFW